MFAFGLWLHGPIDVFRGALLLVGPVLALPVFFAVDTVVTADSLTVALSPPWWRRTVCLDDVDNLEVVLSDYNTPLFGGWSVRDSIGGAFINDLEGDRSFGNKAVRLTLSNGRVLQVGSFKPVALCRALRRDVDAP